MLRKTKIVCTVGPATDTPGILEKMIESGMNVARFNFSHGSHEEHAKRIAMVRSAASSLGQPVALMIDNKGPEVRLGLFVDGSVDLEEGQTFTLTTRVIEGNKEIASVNYENLHQDVQVGSTILLNDGIVGLDVISVEGTEIVTKVKNSGKMSDRKRVAVPGIHLKLPPVSESDIEDLKFGISQKMDFYAASFVQHPDDIRHIRDIMKDNGYVLDIIAKIENSAGVKNFDAILEVVDGVMVARGDLAVEIPMEEVPPVQKWIISKCNKARRPVITATQMLESMMVNPRPTRAEISDVANAILDGTDAIMLSGESAMGKYPVESVQTMARIAITIEETLDYGKLLAQQGLHREVTITEAISHATVGVAHELDVAAIVCPTETGFTARMISMYRPKAPIIAAIGDHKKIGRMCLLRGVYPIKGQKGEHTDDYVYNAINSAQNNFMLNEGDLVILTAGVPIGKTGTTNMMRVVTV